MDIFDEEGFRIARIRIVDSDNNYNYVLWCEETSECAVVDPLNAETLLSFIKSTKLTVKYIINTHAHPDHIEGNGEICDQTKAMILVHPRGQEFISSKSEAIAEGDVINIGKLRIKVMHTPGHCPEHISLIFGKSVFVGDTLFLAGCGNTRYRGNADELYESISGKLRSLPEGYKLFFGHDYALTNLRFALSIEPENQAARDKLKQVKLACTNGAEPYPTTIGEERQYNPFFRFDASEIIEEMKRRKPSLREDPRTIFKELRQLRNDWK